MMVVKICGITRADDAAAAVDAGASAVGFVFWPASPRFIDPYRARAIAAGLPAFVTAVGVFVNQPAAYVNAVAALVPLGAVQLHGDEPPAYLAGVRRPVIKAIPVPAPVPVGGDGASPVNAPSLDIWPPRVMLLVDVHDPARRGGTGRTVDWSVAAAIASRRRTLLAGGLTPENVADAVTRVRPFGIDVSSGVEQAPGIKDPARIRALFHALGGARVGPLGTGAL
ncbi:MAG: phosphoribosylanthranilate isomerase [Acidobacteriota bacterium]